ncbi:phage holin family protein [Pseudonocardia pini]|uniref:phage holin family protein n=1 Tax=Pseudonocardia pini TaxID=2758030 RepID=UPI0015F0880A|nr:phage holin family protein [Pseudonocardia pini]
MPTTDQSTPTPAAEASTAQLVRQLTEQVRTLVTDEVELAKVEMTAKGKALGVGAGLAGAGTIVLLGGGLALIAAAIAALALVLPVWAAALIVGALLLIVGAVLALAGKKQITEGAPPVPTKAIDSTKQDVETLRTEIRR